MLRYVWHAQKLQSRTLALIIFHGVFCERTRAQFICLSIFHHIQWTLFPFNISYNFLQITLCFFFIIYCSDERTAVYEIYESLLRVYTWDDPFN